MLKFLTSPVVKMYMANAMSESQQVWLSNEIINHPTRFPEFLMSKQGVAAFQEYLDAYKRYSQPKAKLLNKDEPVK